jgi:hypothetical protein
MKSIAEAISGLALTTAIHDHARDCETRKRRSPLWRLGADQGKICFGAGFRLPVSRKTR